MKLIRMAFLEVTRKKKLTLFFAATLAVAILNVFIVVGQQTEINKAIEKASESLLGGDLAISSRSSLVERDLESIKKQLNQNSILIEDQSYGKELMTMVSNLDSSRLAFLRAVDVHFPLVGKIKLQENGEIEKLSAVLKSSFGVLLHKSYRELLGVNVGDKVQIGKVNFEVLDFIELDINDGLRGFSFAPPAYVRLEDLPKTGLSDQRSLENNYVIFKLNRPLEEKSLVDLEGQAPKGHSLISPKKLGERSENLNSLAVNFMAIVSVVGTIAVILGLYLLTMHFIEDRIKFSAVLEIIGYTKNQIGFLFIVELVLIHTMGFFIGLAAAFLLDQFEYIKFLFGSNIGFIISMYFGVLVYLILVLVFFRSTGWKRNVSLALNSGLVLLLLFNLTKRYQLTLAGFAVYLLIYLVLHVIILSLIKFVGTLRFKSWKLKHLFLNYNRHLFKSVSKICVLTFGALSLSFIPLVGLGLKDSLLANKEKPDLFLFDIQEEQFELLTEHLSRLKAEIQSLSKMGRGRILFVNGKGFDVDAQDDEALREQKNRGVNILLSEGSSGEIVKGVPFTKNELFEISVEERYASRLGIKIGDKIVFDFQGLEIEAIVSSLRRVRWESFQPNFFITGELGYLDDLPKIGIISAKINDEQTKIEVMKSVGKSFGNVTVIDVQETIGKFEKLVYLFLKSVTWVTATSSILILILFYLLLASSLAEGEKIYRLYVTLGASKKEIISMLMLDAVFSSLFVVTVSTMISVLFFVLVKKYFISIELNVDPFVLILNVFVVAFLYAILPFRLGLSLFKQKTSPKSRRVPNL